MKKQSKKVMVFGGLLWEDEKLKFDSEPIDLKLAEARIKQFQERLPYVRKINGLVKQVSYYKFSGADFIGFYAELANDTSITGLRVYFGVHPQHSTLILIFAPTKNVNLGTSLGAIQDSGEYSVFEDDGAGIWARRPIDKPTASAYVSTYQKDTIAHPSVWQAMGRQMSDGIDTRCMWYSKEVIQATYECLLTVKPQHIFASFAAYKKDGDVHEIDFGGDVGLLQIDKPKHLTLIFSTAELPFTDPEAYDTGAPCPPELVCGNNLLP